MTNPEFNNEFDVLYNNITSNQAPGLDAYEKSVFLTKAQDEIVKAYFDPRSNKVQEGFDSTEKRQIDFSMIIRNIDYSSVTLSKTTPSPDGNIHTLGELFSVATKESDGVLSLPSAYKLNSESFLVKDNPSFAGKPATCTVSPFIEGCFDLRDNTKSVVLEKDIMLVLNEYIQCSRNDIDTRLSTIPINYIEYSRIMSKPYKRPLKNQAWRLLDTSNGNKKAELIVGPDDTITKYVVRYLKRPRAIRLETFTDVTIDGSGEEQTCELDPIIHPEILQRAVELAKAAYLGDLTSQIALGQTSQTSIGTVIQSK